MIRMLRVFLLVISLAAVDSPAADRSVSTMGVATYAFAADQSLKTLSLNFKVDDNNVGLTFDDLKGGLEELLSDFESFLDAEHSSRPSRTYRPRQGVSTGPNGRSAYAEARVSLPDSDGFASVFEFARDHEGVDVIGVEFGSREHDEFKRRVLRSALEDAQDKARLIAEAHRLKLGDLLEISETTRIENSFETTEENLDAFPIVVSVEVAARYALVSETE